MKSFSLIFTLLALLGLGVACSDRDEMQREEVFEEMGHEMDEAGDNIEDTTEEVID